MKTRSFILMCLYCLICQALHGQNPDAKPYSYFIPEVKVPDSDSRIEINKKGDTVLVSRFQIQNNTSNTNQIVEKTYKNTPFFGNRWHKGEVLIDNDSPLSFVMAYNIQKDVVYLVYNPDEAAKALKPIQFTVDGHTFKLFKKRYYETIFRGKLEILKEYQCILQINKPTQKTGYELEAKEGDFEGEFIKSAKYYLKNGEKLGGIPTGQRFFKLFKEQSKIIKNYASSHNLNPNRENDLVAIFKYFESL